MANRKINANMQQQQAENNFINSNRIERNHHDVFIDSEITEPSNYRELISLLFNATEDDTFNFFINSGGGQLNTALAVIEGLKNTNANAMAILVGECHSAASMITMYCHEIAVLDSAHMMIHTASYGAAGNTGNVKSYTDFTTAQVEKLLHDTYEGFLTKEEIAKVKLGVELWFNADEIRSRIQHRIKFLENKAKKETTIQVPKVKKTKE
jgi:ATP-dependent protease ClpP protease subunit